MSEETILKELQKGSQKALKSLFDSYYQELTRYAIKIIGAPETAEEIVQDVFVSIWKNREKSQIKTARHYLLRAVKNRCINWIKSNQPIHDSIDESMHLRAEIFVEADMEYLELEQILELAEKQLSKQTALIFSLSRHTEMTYPEISKELNISVKTVEYHISKALKQMKEFLSQHDVLFLYLLLLT